MGIIIDIVLIAIIILSAFLGYKKGLVKLGAKLVAGIIAIILTLIVYKPVSNFVIAHTSIDEKIEEAIVENTNSYLNNEDNKDNVVINHVGNEMLPGESRKIAEGAVYAITALVLFLIVKIILSIVISLMDFIANLPILKQFNEVGGIIYGGIRGIIIVFICILLMGVITKVNPENKLNETIEDTYITKIVYKKIVKF